MSNEKRTIGILGSTGSIGKNACALLRSQLKNNFTIEFLACENNFEDLSKQIAEFHPKAVCVGKDIYKKTKEAFPNVKVFDSPKTMLTAHKTDVTLHAISGVSGIECVVDAIANTTTLAIANKESIVSAWSFMQEASIEHGTQIIPVDSEHNSLYRILENINPDAVTKLGITASGGLFFGEKFHALKDISPRYAVNHPTWKMGVKNSIDSATMANKVLELIETMQLFSTKESDIDVVINRQSIVHANVWLKSGGVLSFSSIPDMKSHIAHAIMYPDYTEEFSHPLQNTTLEFHEIKKDEFPLFFLGREVAQSENTMKYTVFNVANEIAVQNFCHHKIKYTDILTVVEKSLNDISLNKPSSIEDLLQSISEISAKITEIKI
jgi:1-deoxy-D-xylulose-5-phosphate reductoisomerase